MENKEELIEFRLRKLEDIAEKLAENQVTLTRIDAIGLENQKTIIRLHDRLDKQGTAIDAFMVEQARMESEIDTHKWLIRLIGGAFITAIVAAIAGSILVH